MLLLDLSPTLPAQAQSTPALDLGLFSARLDQVINYYLVSRRAEGKSPETLDGYKRRLEAFAAFIKRQGTGLDALQLRQFMASLYERKLDLVTINAYYRVLRTFFRWAVAEKLISADPMNNLKPPRIPRKTIKPLSNESIKRILEWCSGSTFLEIRNRAMVLLFLDTGLRLAEMAGIQIADVNFETETVRVMGKGAKERFVRMGVTAQKALLKYLMLRTDGYPCLWVSEERRPLLKSGVEQAIQELSTRAGVTDSRKGPHTYRHTAAINFLRNGGSEFTLQLMLGHSTLAMTRRYVSTLGLEDLIRQHRKFSPVDNLKL